jgi:S1-C subfamily serine protease
VPLTGGSAFESFQFSQGPEGVSIRVETETNGQRETKTYEGESLAAILEANPELAKKLSAGRSALQPMPGFAPESGSPARPEPEASAAPLRTDVLGVIVREPTAAERGRAGLSQGGMAVERVAEGTIADVVGLRPGAILVEINGQAIDSREAISAALAERAPDGELRLTLFDAFGRRQTRTWRPAPAGPARSAGF